MPVSFDSYSKLTMHHFKTKGPVEKDRTTLCNENCIQFITWMKTLPATGDKNPNQTFKREKNKKESPGPRKWNAQLDQCKAWLEAGAGKMSSVSISFHLIARLSCVGFSIPLGVARRSPAASGYVHATHSAVGKKMRVHFLTVPTKAKSPDWPGLETMPMPTAVL